MVTVGRGLLTGKYLNGPEVGVRLSPTDSWGARHFTPQATATVTSLAEAAKQQGSSLTALSLAWTLQRSGITSVVVGPRSVPQLDDQLAALDLSIAPEVLDLIDRAVPPGSVTVPYYLDDAFADFRPHRYRW